MQTAIILSSVLIGLNNFFSGLIVRPQIMIGTFFAFTYYITPGHYVYEGLVISLYDEDNRTVYADNGSEFYIFLNCTGNTTTVCPGTVGQYIDSFFGGNFTTGHTVRNAFILGAVLVITRALTFVALRYIRYS